MNAALLDPPTAPSCTPGGRSPFTEDWPPVSRRPSVAPFGGFTLDQITARLGPMPAWRVRSWPAPGTATFADAVACAARGELVELYDGILLEKTLGHWESVLGLRVGSRLRAVAEAKNAGVVAGADGQIELPAEQQRLPDAAFTDWSKMPNGYDPTVTVPELSPTIACEVISASNTREEMDRKLREYFDAGAKLVWYVYPGPRTVRVHTSATDFTTLSEDAGDTLNAGDVLPWFSLPLAELFAVPRPPGANGDAA